MAGRSFATIAIDQDEKTYAAIATFSGGGTQPKTREVPELNVGGTMREEPTGGETREDIEITIIEREDENFLIDALYKEFLSWRDTEDQATRRRPMTVFWYRDKKLTKATGRHEINGAWPKMVSTMEADRSSDDPRQFTVTLTHLGSSYETV